MVLMNGVDLKHGSKSVATVKSFLVYNDNTNIFMQDCCFSFKKKTAINAGPVKN